MGVHTVTEARKARPARLYLLSQPRTRSNLWMKLFESHPSLTTLKYPFQEAWMYGPEHQRTRGKVPELQKRLDFHKEETYQRAFERMLSEVQQAEAQNKTIFIKDHSNAIMTPSAISEAMTLAAGRRQKYLAARNTDSKETHLDGVFEYQSNWRRCWTPPKIVDSEIETTRNDTDTITPSPLLLPESFLQSVQPVIIIRNPLRLLHSYYRTASVALGAEVDDSDFPLAASLSLSRYLYEYFAKFYPVGDKRHPVIFDGDDIVRDPKGLIQRFCSVTGVDESGVTYVWEPMCESKLALMNGGHRPFLETLATSTGVNQCTVRGVMYPY